MDKKTGKTTDRDKKGGRVLFTAAVLLLLVIAASWTLYARGKAKEASAEPQQEQDLPKEPIPEEKLPEETSEEEKKKEEAEKAAAAEAERAAGEKASYTTDYESAPLLNTTPIRYLSMEVGATEDELRFNWMSPDRNPGQVSFADAQTGEVKSFAADCAASVTTPGYYVNKASVTGLQQGKTYVYKVGNDTGGWSPEYQYTVPDVNTKEGFTFLVTSDAQIGQDQNHEEQVTVDDWDKMVTRLTSYVPEAQFLIHAGDQVSQFGSAQEYEGFLNHLGLYKIPLVPVVGNHDVANEDSVEELGYSGGPFFYEHFNVPNRSEEYGLSQSDKDGNYYFIRGDVLFLVLNSATAQPTDIHEEYVPKVIAEHPDTKWRVIIQHYPAYSSVQHYQEKMDPWIRNSLAYICEDNDIDLVISGHDAAYARSGFTDRKCQVYEGYDYSSGGTAVNPEGTLYITCSTASGSIYNEVSPSGWLKFEGQPHAPVALRFDVTDTQLHMRAYTTDSWTLYDEYTIQKD